jgi:hypothetical protein
MIRAVAAALLVLLPCARLAADPGRPVSFNRDVRPILSDACFQCHGPDQAKRKAELDLTTAAGGQHAIGDLLGRVTSTDPAERMPPPKAGPALSPKQIAVLRDWIAQGAKWEAHWSFIPPTLPPLPAVKNTAWPRNPLDRFVLARLEREGLTPSPEADRITLLRRVSLDLTGLPPTPEEVDAFLKDEAADAYERAVDRLLKSPRYGERMAHRWLDAARYADTNGYQTDGDRVMWRWRDWVIEAFNSNMPFDRFTVEQIAGDLLPNATLDQKLATGFNRNHRGNSEGGVIPEEYAVEYVVDRVDTTATVWLGLTAGCAKCHSHKYDPLTQVEFYRLFAYFNNVPERGKAIKYGNSPPYLKTPTREQQVKLKLLESQLLAARRRFEELQPALKAAQARWEKSLDRTKSIDWSLTRGLVAHFPLDAVDVQTAGPPAPLTLRAAHGSPTVRAGRVGNAVHLDGRSYLDAGDVGKFGFMDAFTLAAWVKPEGDGSILSRMVDSDRADGYNVALDGGKIHVHLVKRWLDDAIRIETIERLTPGKWQHVAVTYDGSRVAAGVKVYVDGRPATLKVNLDDLNQNFVTDEPLRIGAGGGTRFHGTIDEVCIYDHALPPEDAALLATAETINVLVGIAHRTPAQAHKLRSYFLEKEAPAEIRAAFQKQQTAAKELADFDATIPTTMVMEEMPTPRDTHVLLRGEYDKRGPKVMPGLPAALPPLPKGVPNNRLGFAYWLVSKDNPLTARVAVNRHWQMLFGTGLVKSVEDFGAQGEWPSHPELLDGLAVEFRDNGWDVKKILKTIVTSATYRQSSSIADWRLRIVDSRSANPQSAIKNPQSLDPENRLLARGPRVRLPAEMIRDQALYASGLLVEKVGGTSVRPYQPAGLVKELHGTADDPQDHGPNLYRRSLYTFWKRTVAPPALMTFDAANRETCVIRETRTNTPLQALNLMNDVTYVEAARVLAQRVLREASTPDERLTRAFRLAAVRPPRPVELAVLRAGLDQHRATYRHDIDAARKLVEIGEAPRPSDVDVAELAAYTATCNLILNLDEVISKE